MFNTNNYPEDIEKAYELLLKQIKHLLSDKYNMVTNLSNASALLNQFFDNINWVGFYLYNGEKLYLGPFQGLPACTHISMGTGVCGTSASKLETLIIDNVHEFKGHIACDSASNSEIVVPMIKSGALIGVLDIDSPIFSRFDKVDKYYLEKIVNIITETM